MYYNNANRCDPNIRLRENGRAPNTIQLKLSFEVCCSIKVLADRDQRWQRERERVEHLSKISISYNVEPRAMIFSLLTE